MEIAATTQKICLLSLSRASYCVKKRSAEEAARETGATEKEGGCVFSRSEGTLMTFECNRDRNID